MLRSLATHPRVAPAVRDRATRALGARLRDWLLSLDELSSSEELHVQWDVAATWLQHVSYLLRVLEVHAVPTGVLARQVALPQAACSLVQAREALLQLPKGFLSRECDPSDLGFIEQLSGPATVQGSMAGMQRVEP